MLLEKKKPLAASSSTGGSFLDHRLTSPTSRGRALDLLSGGPGDKGQGRHSRGCRLCSDVSL